VNQIEVLAPGDPAITDLVVEAYGHLAAEMPLFEYVEMFYNPTRKHTNNGMLSPVDYEAEQSKLNEAGV
jgi:putative transposase